MVQVAFVADTHADEHKKWDEHCRVMDWIAADIRSRKVDLIAHAGDVFEGASTPLERTYVAEWIRTVTQHAPLVIVAGNHDRQRDIEFMDRLRTDHEIVAVERPGVHVLNGIAVACLPWPRTANLLAALGREVGHDESQRVAVEALRDVLLGLGDELARHDGPRILLGHAMVEGSKTDSRQPIVGADLTISVADLTLAKADLVVVGHVHAEQSFAFNEMEVVYPGCPYHRTFGEPGPTSYLIGAFEPSPWWHCLHWKRIPVPATPMLLLTADWDAERGGLVGTYRDADVAGAEVRLRYTVAADQRGAARVRAEEYRLEAMALGAVHVHSEEVVQPIVRARAPEVAMAKTVADKLIAYWHAKGAEISDARRARVLDRLAELESAS